MKKTVSDRKVRVYAALERKRLFYIDKTDFIRQWWESGDDVTLIARPRRFGKTLNMDMLNCFFSNEYEAELIFLKVFRYGRMRSSARSTEHCRGRSQ